MKFTVPALFLLSSTIPIFVFLGYFLLTTLIPVLIASSLTPASSNSLIRAESSILMNPFTVLKDNSSGFHSHHALALLLPTP